MAVDPAGEAGFLAMASEAGFELQAIGECLESDGGAWVEVI